MGSSRSAASHGQAKEIARAVRSTNALPAIGLQLRQSPTVARVRELLTSGALGQVLNVRALSSTAAFGPDVPPWLAYPGDLATFGAIAAIQGARSLNPSGTGGGIDAVSVLGSRQIPFHAGRPRRRQHTV